MLPDMAYAAVIRADTTAECTDVLDRVCKVLDLEPSLAPGQLTNDRWIARATPAGGGSSAIPPPGAAPP